MDEESANKFISALIKSVQTLCHGYVDFSNGVEIIGHINLNIDKGSSFDYILKEKVCRNDENSTLFISNSFHAQPKGEQAFKPNSVQSETHVSHRRHSTDTSESNKLSSVISSISTALSGSHSQTKSRSGSRDNLTSNTHQSHPVQSTAKRKAEDDISSDLHPVKSASISRHDSSSGHQHFFTSQSPSHPSGSNSPIDSKASFIPCVGDSSQRTSTSLSDDVHSHVTATMLPQTASITSDNQSDIGVNLEGSVLERIDDRSNSETHDKDDSDLDLEVTFIKEEYVEGDRSACEFQNSSGNQALNRASNQRASSDGVQDPPLYPVALHTNASATYVPSSHEIAAMAHYAAAGAIQQNSMGMPGSSQPQPGPSGLGQSGMRGSGDYYAPTKGRYSGMRVDFANYKILDKSEPMPLGYQPLVEGSPVAVPIMWLRSVLTQCEGRSSSFVLTMLTNGLIRPSEVVHGGTNAYTGTYLEPVIFALKMYGVKYLNFNMSQATRVLNIKLCTGRRIRRRQMERAFEQSSMNSITEHTFVQGANKLDKTIDQSFNASLLEQSFEQESTQKSFVQSSLMEQSLESEQEKDSEPSLSECALKNLELAKATEDKILKEESVSLVKQM